MVANPSDGETQQPSGLPTDLEAASRQAAETSTAQGLALMLETACSDFETMQRLIRQEVRLLFANGREDLPGQMRAQMALAKSFIFYVVRARRICEHGAGSLTLDRMQRRAFLKSTAGALNVRDVNEHGFDLGGFAGKRTSQLANHHHLLENALVDETSMIIVSDQDILMGPLNLYDVYLHTDIMRKIAGFSSLSVVPSA